MIAMCHDCAFRPGTDAARCPWTGIKARVAVILGCPEDFECHIRPGPCAGAAAFAEQATAVPDVTRCAAEGISEFIDAGEDAWLAMGELERTVFLRHQEGVR